MIEFRDEIVKNNDRKKIIYIGIAAFLIIIIFILVCMFLLKYNVEGEKNLPFEIKNMLIISSADARGVDDKENRWNLEILQNNDVYIEINEKKDRINNIVLQNFNILNEPKQGELKIYHPVNDKDLIYIYKDENIVNEKIEYKSSNNSNVKNLEITKQGGVISFSSCIDKLATYISNEDTEIKYDGTLLKKVNLNYDEIKYSISFDMIVETESNKKYKATFNLDLPPQNLLEEGIVKNEIKDFSNIVFKRV